MGFLLKANVSMIVWFPFAAPVVQSTRCIRQLSQREIQALMVVVHSMWNSFPMNPLRFVHHWISCDNLFLCSLSLIVLWFLLLLISIHAMNACTPCSVVLVPSAPPYRIQSVRWTTTYIHHDSFIYPVLTFPFSRDAFFHGLLLCELVWSEESREISVPNRRRWMLRWLLFPCHDSRCG